jgi:hypothetical protein
VHNAGMKVFASLNQYTYRRVTLEFLSTFHDDLVVLGRNTTLSFRLNHELHVLTFEVFYTCFGFSTDRELDTNEEVVQEAQHAWQQISVFRNTNFMRRKTATIQNHAIRYFTTFLVNSIFGKGDTSDAASLEMCVIYNALHPNMENRVNLVALLIQHFRQQRSATSGDICCSGLVTQISYLSWGVSIWILTI